MAIVYVWTDFILLLPYSNAYGKINDSGQYGKA